MTNFPNETDSDTLWGVAGSNGIALFLKKPPRTVYYMINRGMLPVRRLGRKTITASKSQLQQHLRAPEQR